MGDLRNPSDPESRGPEPDNDNETRNRTLSIRFKVEDNNHHEELLEAILWQNRLYLTVTSDQIRNRQGLGFSKEALVELLEMAEERLNCGHMIIGVENNQQVFKNFLFLGFRPLAPGHEFLPPLKNTNNNLVYFVYNI